MIDQIKKIGLVLTIAILFTVFVFAMTNAFYESPKYEDYCSYNSKYMIPGDNCTRINEPECNKGQIDYKYDGYGCPTEAICNMCNVEYNDANEKYRSILFFISSIAGVLAILFGLYYPKNGEFWNSIESGFLVGGLISLFFGTIIYYNDMNRFLKPITILVEMLIVILVTKKVLDNRKKK